MENILRKRIILKNSKETTKSDELTAKQGEVIIDYANATKPTIKVGPAGATITSTTPVELYAKCEQITNNSGVKISETGESTFGNMKSTAGGIDANSKDLTNLGMLTLTEKSSYGTSLPEGAEGQVFFLIQSK